MPTKRTKVARHLRITPDAVAAYRAGDIEALDIALGKIPFSDPSPLEADTDQPPAGVMDTPGLCWRKAWPEARALRLKLEAICAKG